MINIFERVNIKIQLLLYKILQHHLRNSSHLRNWNLTTVITGHGSCLYLLHCNRKDFLFLTNLSHFGHVFSTSRKYMRTYCKLKFSLNICSILKNRELRLFFSLLFASNMQIMKQHIHYFKILSFVPKYWELSLVGFYRPPDLET